MALHQNFIDGKWAQASAGAPNINPSNVSDVVGEYARADELQVMVNLPTAGVDYHVPFGGRKGSSYGPREQGRYAAEFYTAVKTAYVNP
jgi:acyl-CoA reductase-like NAD-dependent aldehyde dehydrogenase